MASQIKFLRPNLALWEGHYDHFQGQKTRFLGFLKVGLELFRSCLGIVQEHFVTIESVPFRAENNAQITSEQLQTKFKKPQKTGFLTLKMVKITLSEGQIWT